MPEGGHLPLLKKEKKTKYLRRQQEVLDAAAAVIARKGYHGASTTDIAGELGVAQPSLYYYFASKDEALEEICRIGIAGYLERLQAIMDGTGATRNKIRDAIRAHIEPVRTIPITLNLSNGSAAIYPPSAAMSWVALLGNMTSCSVCCWRAGCW